MKEFIEMMGLPSLKEDERPTDYCIRLEQLGFDEVFIRKTLNFLFDLTHDECTNCFNDLDTARLRYITMIGDHPARTGKALVKRLEHTFGFSENEATEWVARYEKSEGITYLNWFPSGRTNFHP